MNNSVTLSVQIHLQLPVASLYDNEPKLGTVQYCTVLLQYRTVLYYTVLCVTAREPTTAV